MAEFDVEEFVAKMERLGMKLTVVPLADGKLRVNRWRTLQAAEHTQQIEELWTSRVGSNQERIDQLAQHLYKQAPVVTANRVLPRSKLT
jgi:hypothetical protein